MEDVNGVLAHQTAAPTTAQRPTASRSRPRLSRPTVRNRPYGGDVRCRGGREVVAGQAVPGRGEDPAATETRALVPACMSRSRQKGK